MHDAGLTFFIKCCEISAFSMHFFLVNPFLSWSDWNLVNQNCSQIYYSELPMHLNCCNATYLCDSHIIVFIWGFWMFFQFTPLGTIYIYIHTLMKIKIATSWRCLYLLAGNRYSNEIFSLRLSCHIVKLILEHCLCLSCRWWWFKFQYVERT